MQIYAVDTKTFPEPRSCCTKVCKWQRHEEMVIGDSSEEEKKTLIFFLSDSKNGRTFRSRI